MKFVVAKTAGFCMGVRRAVDMVLDASNLSDDPIYTYGPLIHNPQVLEMLEKKQVFKLDKIPAIELNISCPNVKEGGMAFGVTCPGAEMVTKEVRKAYDKTLIVKLSPNVTDITDIAKAVEGQGADSVSLVNTFLGMAIDAEKRIPLLSTITGGLSGPAIKPIALRMVWQVYNAVKIPVIGIGGIMNATDAIEFMLAGATAIQVGTAIFKDPFAPVKIIEGINDYLERHNIQRVSDLTGALQL
ncbi:MAG: dihydroorotate dehydrogenase [Draconibacterium sp.]|nr:dihydroorotate dehydrogenase [Draconibacterium sp.]